MSPGALAGAATIVAKDLRRRFGDVEAVDGVDLEVGAGEIFGFLGPNGAGKSTTVRVLCTLLAPTGGRASVAGFDVSRQASEVRLRIGVALQEASLDEKQTGRELLRLQGRLYGLRRNEIDRRLDDLATLVDIGAALDRRVSTYSGGMRRRIDLAAALIHNPQVLFLDEPTTGLDPVSRARVWDEVRRLNRELGMTIFLTTQYLEEADALADRVAIINRGRIVGQGTPAELKRSIGADVIVARVDDPATAVAVLTGLETVEHVEAHGDEVLATTSHGAAALSPVAVALARREVAVQELTLRQPTLDDVFLELTGSHLEQEAEA